ncbi:MAG: hypothetical protein HC824_00855 [Synechococcales cyanobacterium RM1_1_8]|nr:hypothetical protein [Synechococcales cyanobacterium RM1_1_8]
MTRSSNLILYLSATFLIVGAIALVPHGNFLNEQTAVPGFWRAMAIMNAGFILSWCLPAQAVPAAWFWVVAVATRIAALGMYPGDDVWRYLWEGHIQLQGFSPYDVAPDANLLEPLRTGWWSMINHKDVSAIYPPLTQLGFWAISLLSSSVYLFKLGFVAADLGICTLLGRRFGYGATLLYAWNPLVIYCFAGGAHYDSWFLLPLVMAWLWWEQPDPPRSPLSQLNAAFWLGCSIAIKWMSLPILSFLVWQCFWSTDRPRQFSRHPFGARLKQAQWLGAAALGLVALLPVVITALPYCSLTSCPLIPTGSVFVSHGRSAEWIPHWVAQNWEPSLSTNAIYAIPLMMAIAWLLLRARSFGQFAEWYFISLLLISPIVHAWYFTWLAPFAVASRNWGTKFVSVSALAYFVLPHQVALGDSSWWMEQSDRLLLWIPFCLGLLLSAIQAQRLAQTR